jgi:hypothetical protein
VDALTAEGSGMMAKQLTNLVIRRVSQVHRLSDRSKGKVLTSSVHLVRMVLDEQSLEVSCLPPLHSSHGSRAAVRFAY